jgi:hypothetical protein
MSWGKRSDTATAIDAPCEWGIEDVSSLFLGAEKRRECITSQTPKARNTHHTNTNDPRLLPPDMLHQQSELGRIKRSVVYGLRGIGVSAAVEVVKEDAIAFGG